MFPLVYGVCNEDDNNKGNIMLPPIFDSFNKDNDGEGLVPPLPCVFNSYNEGDMWRGPNIVFPPYFWLLNKDEKEEEGGEHCHPPSLVFRKQRYEGSDNIIKKF
jgi:hypothetical protein